MKLRIFVALVAGLCLTSAVAAAAGQDTNPAWIKQPTAGDIFSVFPAAAVAEGIDGKVVIDCEAAIDGSVRNCAVVSEAPAGMGFGAAALSLTPQLRMRPALRGGVPTAARVRIPINFNSGHGEGVSRSIGAPIPPIGQEGVDTYTRLPWDRAPSSADVAAAYPAQAGGAAGYAMLNCNLERSGSLSHCWVAREQPEGKGFGKAAKKLMDHFHTSLPPPSDKPVWDARVVMGVHFDAPGAPDPGIARQLEWTGRPEAADLTFPSVARAAGKREGKGVIDCRIEGTGMLADCHIASEDPAGLGFGAAALALAPKFRVNPWLDGRTMEGRRIKLPIGFIDDQALPSASAQ